MPLFHLPVRPLDEGTWRKMVEETLLGPGASPGVLFDRGTVERLWRDYLAGRPLVANVGSVCGRELWSWELGAGSAERDLHRRGRSAPLSRASSQRGRGLG